MVDVSQVSKIYQTMLDQKGKEGMSTRHDGAPSFSDILKESISGAIDAQKTSEKVSAAAVLGKADMTDVLKAVNDAELALNTVLAVRDRVVQAYQQIMRTTI